MTLLAPLNTNTGRNTSSDGLAASSGSIATAKTGLEALLETARSDPNGLQRGAALRALDLATGSRMETDQLVRGGTMEVGGRVQVAQAAAPTSTFPPGAERAAGRAVSQSVSTAQVHALGQMAGSGLKVGNQLLTAASVMQAIQASAERSQVTGVITRFGLNPAKVSDLLAARAYVWAATILPAQRLFDTRLPMSGPVNERIAQAVMRNEQAHPGTLGFATHGDAAAQRQIDKVIEAALAGPAQKPERDPKSGGPTPFLVPLPTQTRDRRRDDTCAPKGTIGTWEVMSRPGMKKDAADYQRQIAHTPDLGNGLMVEYRVTDVKTKATAVFDGCAVWSPDHELLEAKFGHGDLFRQASRYPKLDEPMTKKIQDEVRSQAEVTRDTGHPVEWHVSDATTLDKFRELVKDASIATNNFTVIHTPKINK